MTGGFARGHIERARQTVSRNALACLVLACLIGYFGRRDPVYWGLAGLCGVCCVWYGGRAFRYLVWPLTEPLTRALASYGPPLQIADEIERERRQALYEAPTTLITPTWLIQRVTRKSWKVARLEDVVWAYIDFSDDPKVSRGTGSHQLFLFTMQGIEIAVQDQRYKIEHAWEGLRKLLPEALLGYDPRVEYAWDQGLVEFLAIVDKRRAEQREEEQVRAEDQLFQAISELPGERRRQKGGSSSHVQ